MALNNKKFYHMKIKLLLIGVLAFLLSACIAQQPYIMPPLKYNGSVAHVDKKAYILWQRGKVLAGEIGIGANSFNTTAPDRENTPPKYTLSYGKAQQASFIISFKNLLRNNQAFKDVQITTNPANVKADDALIIVKFKYTRVNDIERNYKIILAIEMTIKSGESSFVRTYMTESDEGGAFDAKNFDEQLTDVSEKMIVQLMHGINQWSQQQ